MCVFECICVLELSRALDRPRAAQMSARGLCYGVVVSGVCASPWVSMGVGVEVFVLMA